MSYNKRVIRNKTLAVAFGAAVSLAAPVARAEGAVPDGDPDRNTSADCTSPLPGQYAPVTSALMTEIEACISRAQTRNAAVLWEDDASSGAGMSAAQALRLETVTDEACACIAATSRMKYDSPFACEATAYERGIRAGGGAQAEMLSVVVPVFRIARP